MSDALRSIPAVEKVLQALGKVVIPRPALTAVVRRELSALRHANQVPALDAILLRVRAAVDLLSQTRLQPVINGTGILIHTNLGRAPMGREVVETLSQLASNYSNLEFDLATGERGGRASYLEHNLALLCNAEAATVVNNCAAALVLTLRHFTRKKPEVVISRGELVQIGGGFRIPEILEASGARLREVGTTNKTSIEDYASALSSATAMILTVHRSNFFMDGFVESPDPEELAALARRKRLPLVEDLGSGAVIKTEHLAGLEHEPTPGEVLKRGVHLVTFSGDKLLGGPQAGIIAGQAKHIRALKREPFFRALRCDKLILGALQTTVDLYLQGAADAAIPVIALSRVSEDELRPRAERLLRDLRDLPIHVQIGTGQSQMGAGSLPRSVLPSVTLDLLPSTLSLAEWSQKLRTGSPPVVGFVSGGRFKLDLRTVFPSQDADLLQAIRTALHRKTPGERGSASSIPSSR